jgi:hypothetical protein
MSPDPDYYPRTLKRTARRESSETSQLSPTPRARQNLDEEFAALDNEMNEVGFGVSCLPLGILDHSG